MLQMFVLPASRVTVRTVPLSETTRLPLASVMSICRLVDDCGSAAMGLVRKTAAVLVAAPAPALVTITLQPVRPAADADSWISPGVFVLVIVTVATPADGVIAPVGFIVASVGVTLNALIVGVLAFVTVLPFASFRAILAIEIPEALMPPFAMIGEGLAVH